MLSPPEVNGLVPRPFNRIPSYDRDVPRPRIGLTAYREPARWGVWAEPADLLPASYASAVGAAGAVALILPAPTEDVDDAAAIALCALDGLLLAGGADVDPARYDAPRGDATGAPRPERDAWEIALTRQAIARGLPVLGVCRGLQVLNTALGGTLVQHLPDVVGHDGHCPVVGEHGRHDVELAAGSRLHGLLGERASVATYHHQAVDRLGDGLEATAWAGDGTVEGIEASNGEWVLGVQWHPEVHDGANLFAGFVRACAR
jgi:gamma-glutamyl-gamma-aminobutyrate hydrolase PuuD